MPATDVFDLNRLALGRIPGVSYVEWIARNADVDVLSVPETIWPAGGLYSFRSAAAVLEVVSSSAADDAAGTGARTIRIHGLDEDWKPVIETIIMDGTTPVLGLLEFLRINFVEVWTVGSGGTNAGNITVRDASAGTTRSYIALGRGHSEDGVYSVAADNTFLFDGWYATVRDADNTSYADIDFMETHNADGGATHVGWSFSVDKVFGSPFTIPHVFHEKTDIEMRVTAVFGNNSIVAFHAHGLLVGPNADL